MESILDILQHFYNQGHTHNFVRRADIAPLTNGHTPNYHFAKCDRMACTILRPWPKDAFQKEGESHEREMRDYLRTHGHELRTN